MSSQDATEAGTSTEIQKVYPNNENFDFEITDNVIILTRYSHTYALSGKFKGKY